jgi:hypothetical protein
VLKKTVCSLIRIVQLSLVLSQRDKSMWVFGISVASFLKMQPRRSSFPFSFLEKSKV